MASIDIQIGGRKYVLRGEEGEPHLRQVAELVQKKMEALKKERPSLTIHTAAILAAFDFASMVVKDRNLGEEYRTAVLGKAHQLLERVESELEQSTQ